MDIKAKLSALGFDLPDAPAPAANYVPWVISGSQLIISGQISQMDGQMLTGKLGQDVDVEGGQHAARYCAVSILAQANAAMKGDWSRIKRLLRLGGFVNATPDFADHPAVINGASDLMVAVLGEAGAHARAAVGCASLPFNVSVEIDAIFEIEPA